MTGIVRATASETDHVATLIGAAFQELAVAGWLVPDVRERARILPANFRIYVEHALEHGEVYLAEGGEAVAVWFHQDRDPAPPPADYDRRMAAACGAYLSRFQALDAAFEAHHPHDPHHHLAFLATRPGLRDRGLGAALLRDHHARLDEYGVSGYLEASSARSRELYLRHGYVDRGEPFALPDGGPSLWPMWRDPVAR